MISALKQAVCNCNMSLVSGHQFCHRIISQTTRQKQKSTLVVVVEALKILGKMHNHKMVCAFNQLEKLEAAKAA